MHSVFIPGAFLVHFLVVLLMPLFLAAAVFMLLHAVGDYENWRNQCGVIFGSVFTMYPLPLGESFQCVRCLSYGASPASSAKAVAICCC